MKNKVNEWQELSLKKDIEKILAILSHNQVTNYAMILEISAAGLVMLFDNILTSEGSHRRILFIILLIAFIAPYIILSIWYGKQLIMKRNRVYETYSISKLKDSFDNEICYHVMVADAYKRMLDTALVDHESNIAMFYYIEICYYINKAKAAMHNMLFNTKKIFTNNPDEIIQKNKIQMSRLDNIINIIEEIDKSLEIYHEKGIIHVDDLVINTNKKYDEFYRDFLGEIDREVR